jgi:DNA-binding winged helix-turn-helix (wHTH) protein/TolB-like protein/Tfp pilus assembly protein PilF
MSEQTPHFYEFGRFRIDVAERLLLREREVVPLTPKVFDILLALIEQSGRIVEKDDLMKRVWPDSFVEEGNLTQNVSLLRKALGEGPNGQRYIETIARRGYRFTATVTKSPSAQIDLTADSNGAGAAHPVDRVGFRPGPDLATAGSANGNGLHSTVPAPLAATKSANIGRIISDHKRGAVLSLAALILAASGIIYLARDGKAVNNADRGIESIAVLPFANDTSDAEMDFFNDAITESLINSLSELPKLRVVPRSLVMGYKGKETDPSLIGLDLNVRVVLTGRVSRRGDTLSIQADLIDVANVSQIWGHHYYRKVSDLLLVQEDISSDIFQNLRLKLSVEEAKHLEAYRLYLKGRNSWNKRTAEGLQQGIDYFQQAIGVDSEYAPAYAGLADCYNMLVVYGVRKPREAFPTAKDAALKALDIDDTLAEAHTSLAFIKFRYNWERLDAEREFNLAIKHNPNYAPAHQWYSSYLASMERFDEAIAAASRAQELEPLSLITDSHIAWILYLAGKHDQAIEQARKMLEIDPNFFPARRYLGLAYEQKGMYAEAVEEFQKGIKLSGSPLMVALLGHAYAASGKKEEARKVLAELKHLSSRRYVSPYTIAAIYTGLGERDQAFDWLERAFEERDIWLMNMKVDPVFSSLRSDKRFIDLLRRTGLNP